MTTTHAPKMKQHRAAHVPPQLATPTDLQPQGVQEITDVLNTLVADVFALFLKTKNYHWHLSGPHFRGYHLLLDEQAATLLAAVDILAERVRRIGGITIHSIGQVNQLQTIRDDNDELVEAQEMLQRLMEDNTHMTRQIRKAHEICERYHDAATTSQLEVLLDEAERRTWFLFEAIQE